MSDPRAEAHHGPAALRLVAEAAPPYLAALPDAPVQPPGTAKLLTGLDGPLPEDGDGTLDALARLIEVGTATATRSTGPRFFHFVCGGSTPAAQAADWLTSLLDQVAGLEAASPFATRAETVVLDWLKDLFGLPAGHGGVLTPSATFANLTGLAAARAWWADKHGVDVVADGLVGLPRMPVLSSGYLHVSSRKAMQILGLGRDSARLLTRDDAGRIDLAALEAALAESGPAVIIGNAGEVNAGDFDPIADLADLAEAYGAWLHVDGAFGLFAATSPRTRHLVAGIERADSIAADGHKWLNVPYESGFAFVKDPSVLKQAFGSWGAAYLAPTDDSAVDYNQLGPESSRRARALPIWATLRAYGREGHRAMVERHLDLALRFGEAVEAAPELELVAPVTLNIVCFRLAPQGAGPASLDELNKRLGQAIIDDGRVFMGTSVYKGMTVLRPAIVNWRTAEEDIDATVAVVRELAARLT
ncbi:pyridoxal-dependent decarboxylase [Phytomonospora sp. NPDC050363]|uniref:pyridoxal phosphate-dependent decarboxylase family protein n=1 Tax=Phytomonospora sp. NPDC050363 TaxID=3155642 RepID=UPI00340EE5FF